MDGSTEQTAVEEVSTETESTATDTAAESTPSVEADVSPEERRAESQKHSVKLLNRTRRQGAEEDTGEQETAETSDTAEVESQTEKKPEVDPDLLKFAENKGFKAESIAASEDLQKSIKMSMESEKRMNQAVNEQKIREDKIKQKQLDKDADSVVNPKAEADPDEPKSPSEAFEVSVQDQFEKMLMFTNCTNEADLQARYPDIYNRFLGAYNDGKLEALKQDVDFKLNQATEKEAAGSSAETMEAEFKKVADVAKDNIATIKKDYPAVVEDMKESGMNDLLDELANITKVPLEYFMASEKFSGMFVKAAKAMIEVSKLPERDNKTKQQVEKDIAKAKNAEMVAAGDPVPDDNRTVAQKQQNDRKARFQKHHRPAPIS